MFHMITTPTAFLVKFLLSTLVLIVVLTSITVFSFNTGSHMITRDMPLMDATMEMKLDATKAHLWFEEILSRHRDDKLETVHQSLDRAKWYAQAMLNGGRNEHGTFLAIDNSELGTFIEAILEKLNELEAITDLRYANYIKNGQNRKDDQRYDLIFSEFIELSDTLEKRVKNIIDKELETYNFIFYMTLIGANVLLIGLAILLYFYIKERKEQHDILIQQARFALMGEMISNIAHQWRQPLNAVGLVLQKMSLFHHQGLLDQKKLDENVDNGMEIIFGMSQTIDNFRDFFNPNQEKEIFSVVEAINAAYNIVRGSYISNSIEYSLETDFVELQTEGYMNEFSQVILNILSNAQDSLLELKVANPSVKIKIIKEDRKTIITISDNAGGIPEAIAEKIFDPYFTTKKMGEGTGIGLYMSKMIIEEHMHGNISFANKDGGVCFRIEI